MGWRQTDPMNERLEFISAWLKGEDSVTGLSARFDVSRKTAYKWIERYKAHGPAGLYDVSRAPLCPAGVTSPGITARVVKLRRAHPAWGPRKLKARLKQAAAQLVCGDIVCLRTALGFLHAENRRARRFSGAAFRGLARRGFRRGRGGGRSGDERGQRGQGQGGGDQQDGAAHGRLGRDQPVAHQHTDESGRNDGAFAGRQALFDFRHQGQHKYPCAADQAVMGSLELQGAGRIIHTRRLAWAGRG